VGVPCHVRFLLGPTFTCIRTFHLISAQEGQEGVPHISQPSTSEAVRELKVSCCRLEDLNIFFHDKKLKLLKYSNIPDIK
jgi:hypothetical protein